VVRLTLIRQLRPHGGHNGRILNIGPRRIGIRSWKMRFFGCPIRLRGLRFRALHGVLLPDNSGRWAARIKTPLLPIPYGEPEGRERKVKSVDFAGLLLVLRDGSAVKHGFGPVQAFRPARPIIERFVFLRFEIGISCA
jgi:hypothetical protein